MFRYILTPEWIRESKKAGRWLPEKDFLISSPQVGSNIFQLESFDTLNMDIKPW